MDQNVNANPAPKGAGFLKVVGILMIIFGGIGIIVAIVALLGIGALNVLTSEAGVSVNYGLAYVGAILSLLSAAFELVAGILGVKNAKKPEKAGVCMAWGIVVACMAVLGAVFTAVAGSDFPVFSLLLGLVMPVLFIIGAALNKKA